MSMWKQLKIILLAAALVGALVFTACGGSPTPAPTPAPTPTATPAPTPAPTPTATPTSTPTPTPAPTPTATPAPTPAPTPTATPTSTPTPTPMPSMETSTPATTLAITVAPIRADIPEYSRSQYKHWVDDDGDCQDARQEVLILESLVEVTFESEKECRVATGQWYGAFTGAYVETPGELDIDHLVPLKNAHNSGGWAWASTQKQEYANDLVNPDHLIAVTRGANRSKGARGPEDWRPPDESYWCQYATDWTAVKMEWGLTMTQRESEATIEMLDTCPDPIGVEVQRAEGTSGTDMTMQPEAADATAMPTSMPELEPPTEVASVGVGIGTVGS